MTFKRNDIWIAENPNGLICLVRLFVSVAFQARAFSAHYLSVRGLLEFKAPPDGLDYIEAMWKKEFLD
jgi:hypothetical protein